MLLRNRINISNKNSFLFYVKNSECNYCQYMIERKTEIEKRSKQKNEASKSREEKEYKKKKKQLKIEGVFCFKELERELQEIDQKKQSKNETSSGKEHSGRQNANKLEENFPKIHPEIRDLIHEYWGKKGHDYELINKSMKMKINYHSFKTLQYQHWLNDEAINGYVSLLNQKLGEKKSSYRILHSLFIVVFSKEDEKIRHSLKKQNISEKSQIVIVINHRNHWFFLLINDEQMAVFDSIKKHSSQYEQLKPIKSIKRFMERYHDKNLVVQTCDNFPQQANTYDCGMFMLCGIKDVVFERKWTFQQKDMNERRLEIASQLIKEEANL